MFIYTMSAGPSGGGKTLVTGGVSGVKRIVMLLQIMQLSHLIYYTGGGEAFYLDLLRLKARPH